MEPLRVCRVCGLEAWTEEDLLLFSYHKNGKYKKSNLCKKCRNKSKRKPNPPYLRKCRVCGLEAYINKDLSLFVKSKNKPYGRETICKKCDNINQTNYRKERLDKLTDRKRKLELIEGFPKPILCYFCGKEVTILDGNYADSINIHSLDGNHDNWEPANKVPAHHACHSKYHNLNSSPEILVKRIRGHVGEKHPLWKGEKASPQAKYYRKRRAMKRESKIKILLEKTQTNCTSQPPNNASVAQSPSPATSPQAKSSTQSAAARVPTCASSLASITQ